MVGTFFVKSHNILLSADPEFYRTYMKIQQAYFWPAMKTDINRNVRYCEESGRFKASSKGAH